LKFLLPPPPPETIVVSAEKLENNISDALNIFIFFAICPLKK
jgi:hypothetical protein